MDGWFTLIVIGLAFGYGESNLNVVEFGAIGDGQTDDSEIFLEAWSTLCEGGGNSSTLLIPAGKSFLLKPLTFKGPCNSTAMAIQIEGNIVAPKNFSNGTGCESGRWLNFLKVKGLTIKGKGQINGSGRVWWNRTATHQFNNNSLYFERCDNLQLDGFTSIDSPKMHITVDNSTNISISNLHLNAPENSPNTDGIDISDSSQVNIQNTFIGTGDDCIAIKKGSSYINITHVACGPGHGISIGSLGKGVNDTVEEVHVRNCSFNGSTNGARIKTFKGGSGYARAITFEHITLSMTKFPIIIDQEYNSSMYDANKTATAVKVSDVTFRNFRGTSATLEAIKLVCSDVECINIVIDNVNITSAVAGKNVTSSCKNARGIANATVPPVSCLIDN
ncbi:hypothetical protein UlMin_035547 [Ulmus minor]